MPCMISLEQANNWLYEGALAALNVATYNETMDITYYPVDLKVNNSKNQSPELIEALSP